MLLCMRQSISSWNIEISQLENNVLVALISLKGRNSIPNYGLLAIIRFEYAHLLIIYIV